MAEHIQEKAARRSHAVQVGLLTLGIALVGSNSLVLSPILTDVAADFDARAADVARAIAAYGGATALSAFALARHIDRVGPRLVLLLGMVVMMLAIGASAFAHSWVALALAQGMAGIGAGVVLPATYHLAATVSPKGAEARTLGRVLTGWSLSLVLGIPAASLLTDLAGWRSVFLVLAGIGFLALIGFVRLLPRDRPALAPTHEGPLAPLKIPTVPILLATCFAFMIGFYGVYPFVGDHLRVSHGIAAAPAGLFVLAYGIGFGLASLGDGLIDRFGLRRMFPLALLTVALISLAMIPASLAFWSVIALSAIWGFVNHFGLNALVLLLSRADPVRRGAILGLNSAVTYAASFIGAAVFGEIYADIGFAAICGLAGLALAIGALLVHVGLRGRLASAKASAAREST